MTTRGWKKAECKRGHVAPERTKQGACVPCRKLYRAEHYQQDRAAYIKRVIERAKENPEARRDHQRAHRLGVPVSEVREAIERSGGQCQACECPLTHATMCVDHDHITGRVRGVLCRFCNALEGMLNKQAGRVAKVQAYLARETERIDQPIPYRLALAPKAADLVEKPSPDDLAPAVKR